MGFTIICNECNQKQELTKESYYDQKDISLEVDAFVDHWEALSIECKNCKQIIEE